MLKKLTTFVLNCIFPILCIECKRAGAHCCKDCLQKIRATVHPAEFERRNLRIISFAPVQEHTPLLKFIHRFKYDGVKEIGEMLGDIFEVPRVIEEHMTLVPVPLHRYRENWRGFNQSKLIADFFASHSKAPVEELLMRHRNTKPQVELSKEKRQSNVAGAFGLRPHMSVSPNTTYCLIDDVVTTGSTLHACANVLHAAGAQKIRAMTLGYAV